MDKVILQGGTALLDAFKILKRIEIKEAYVVADLGCGGGGHFVAPLAKMVGINGKVYALDVQKRVIEAVESKMKFQKILNVETVWSNLEVYGAAKIPNESCDVVVIVNVLFQNTQHSTIINEATRMLRPGGRLAVIDWMSLSSPFGPPLNLRISPERLKSIVFNSGLRLFDEFDAGSYHYVEVFRKE
ncbi:methyltransferase domain-containing protein [Candidatus Uhrbacteria bacterium]|nr:methyltransferase domain-containing protein [Candidatus Uhrbacteria bacterium]